MWSEDDPKSNNGDAMDEGNPDEEEKVDKTDLVITQVRTEQTKLGRERSMSVPCSNTTTDVETVVSKAKRASLFLWMLLHSQNCSLAADRCTHNGCADGKLVHLHLKTCPACQDFPCPTRHAGCVQARKLLAHYRQCRIMRVRQIGLAPSGRSQHVCLICSMVARHARSLLDNNDSCSNTNTSGASKMAVVHKRSFNGSKCQVVSSKTVTAMLHTSTMASSSKSNSAPLKKRILSSFTLSQSTEMSKPFPAVKPGAVGDLKMPPPAPRCALVPVSAPTSPLGRLDDVREIPNSNVASAPLALLRRRSGSLGSDHLSAARRRTVSFAPRPDLPEPQSDLAVELTLSDLGKDQEELLGQSRRTRSASCHVLSTTVNGQPSGCGTIYEEISHSASLNE